MALISFENVDFYYSPHTAFEKKALSGIDFSIQTGEFIGLIGHTGSGKSTLIQLMNGLLKPTNGIVRFKEEAIFDKGYSLRDLRTKVGLVFQYPEYQLFEETVIADVCFGPKNLGLTKAEANDRAVEALKSVGVCESDFEKSPFELSGGQKRRVAIAGILAMQPEVLILDEPAAGLDPEGKQAILEMTEKLYQETGLTVILSSHSMEDMALYARRLIVMQDGVIVRDDIPEVIFDDYRDLEAMGLAAPQMVYTMHALREKGFDVQTNVLTVRAAAQELMRLWQSKDGGYKS